MKWTEALEKKIRMIALRVVKKADRIDENVALYLRHVEDHGEPDLDFMSCGINSGTNLLWSHMVRRGKAEHVGTYNMKANIADVEDDIKFALGWADCHHAQTGWAKDRLRYKLG